MKNKLVRFNDQGARVEINPSNWDLIIEDKITIFKNPDLKEVENLNPHKWAVENKKIVPAKEHLILLRESTLENKPLPELKYKWVKNRTKIIILGILIISAVSLFFLKKYDITITVTPRSFYE